jgi:hypothetical protein
MTLLRSLRSRPYHICCVIWIILFRSHFTNSCVHPPSIYSIKSPERHLPHLVIHSSEKVAKVRFPLFLYRVMRISYFCHFLQMGIGKEGSEATETHTAGECLPGLFFSWMNWKANTHRCPMSTLSIWLPPYHFDHTPFRFSCATLPFFARTFCAN